MSKLLSVLFISFMIISCGQSKYHSEKKIKKDSSSLKVKKEDEAIVRKKEIASRLKIRKDKLGKSNLFLISGMFNQMPNGEGNSLVSKIIYFEKYDKQLLIFQDLNDHLTSQSIEQFKLLSKINIEKEDKEYFYLNSEESFIKMDHYSLYGPAFLAKNIKNSHMSETVQKDENIYLKSIVGYNEIPFPQGAQGVHHDISMSLFISPYKENKSFKSSIQSETNRKYFIQHNRILDKVDNYLYLSNRFDLSKKVIVYLSSAIPLKYKQAVREGILYWNNVLKKEVVSVLDLPKEEESKASGLNIVWWIEDDKVGSALSDSSTDPRTGEVIRTHIYINQAWAAQTEDEFKVIQASKNKKLERVDKLVSNVILTVSAHEMGHSFGLWHNFAGSYGNNVQNEDQDFYLNNGELNRDLMISSTVMDYSTSLNTSMLAEQIKQGKVLKYDELMINKLYQNASLDGHAIPYCEDRTHNAFEDCGPHDRRTNPYVNSFSSKSKLNELIKNYFVYEFFLSGDKLNNLVKITDSIKQRFSEGIEQNISAFEIRKYYVEPYAELNRMVDFTQEEVDSLHLEKQLNYLESIKLVDLIEMAEDENLIDVAEIHEQLAFNTQIDDEIKSKFLGNITLSLINLSKDLRKIILTRISSLALGEFLTDERIKNIEGALAKLSKHYLLSVSEEKIVQKTALPNDIIVPKFKYDLKTRKLAAQLLLASRAPHYKYFMEKELKYIKKELEVFDKGKFETTFEMTSTNDKGETIINKTVTPIEMNSLGREIRIWRDELNEIRNMLNVVAPVI